MFLAITITCCGYATHKGPVASRSLVWNLVNPTCTYAHKASSKEVRGQGACFGHNQRSLGWPTWYTANNQYVYTQHHTSPAICKASLILSTKSTGVPNMVEIHKTTKHKPEEVNKCQRSYLCNRKS